MSKIRLNGTSSGYTELAPPAAAGSNTITLPSSNGSANQFLKNGSTAGTLGWSSMTESGGNIAVNGNVLSTGSITSQKASGTNAISCIVDGTSGSDESTLLSKAGSCTIQLTTYGSQYAYFTASATNGFNIGNYANSHTAFLTNNAERARITGGGELYIAGTGDQGAYNLQVNGTGVWGAGAYVNGSDERLKEDIQPLADASEVLQKLRPVSFKYKADYSRDQSIQPGFIAQDLQEAMAGQVYLDGVVQQGPEYLNVAYQGLIPVLTKALQEALDKIASLEARITALEAA